MLVAQNSKQKLILLHSTIPREKLIKWKKTEQFFCPQCKESVTLKVGNVKIPHFAHYSNHQCNGNFSEGESINHLLGKEQLFDLFNSLKLPVQLEPYLKVLQQRPDLLISYNDHLYAIEFQCSPIDDEKFSSRNEGYHSTEIKPIWIPHTPQNLEAEMGITKISIPNGLRKYIHHYKNQFYILSLYPQKKRFYYLSNLLHVKGNTFLTKIMSLPTSKQHFPFYLPSPLTDKEFTAYILAYNNIKKAYLKNRLYFNRQGVQDIFLRSIYELRLPMHKLPIFLGIPLKGNEHLSLFAVEWQTALFYFLHLQEKTVSEMDDEKIVQFLNWTRMPPSREGIQVVKTYCTILKNLSIESLASSVSQEELERELYRQFLAFTLDY